MQIWSRRRIETVVLACLGLTAIVPFRFFAAKAWFLSEVAASAYSLHWP